jgi:hypothetical protein
MRAVHDLSTSLLLKCFGDARATMRHSSYTVQPLHVLGALVASDEFGGEEQILLALTVWAKLQIANCAKG